MDCAAAILIVEDDELYATMLAEAFAEAGYEVGRAGDVAGARQLLAQRPFDAIVADLHLPDSGGHLPAALLADAGDTPLLLITGTPTIDSALQSMREHVFAYQVKPFEIAAFLETVARAVLHGGLHKRLAETRRRYQSIGEQLDALRGVAGEVQDVNQSLADYLRLLMGSSMESLAEAVEILGTLERGQLSRPLRQVSRHPEAEMFRSAIEETIDVLEKTRGAFKSRELGDLRRRLEMALKLGGDQGPPIGRQD